ncbi:MAG: YCF48-related protein [Bacteroidota bacterium]
MLKIIFSAIACFFSIQFSFAQWVHTNPGTTDLISDISFVTDQIGYAVDEHTGRLWKTTDGATNWNIINTSAGAWRIIFLTPDTGFSVSSSGLIKTTDGGTTWNQAVVPGNTGWWSRPVFFNHQSGISIQQNATSDSMIVMKTSDGGDTWHTIMERPDSLGAYISDISFPDSMTGYLTSETSMYKTTDGGYTWSLLQWRYPSYGSISFITPDTGYSYIDLDQFYRTYDGGQTWDSFPLPTAPYNGQVRFINSSVGFICGGNGFSSGYVMKTMDAGTTWTLEHSDSYTYFAFSFPGNNVGYACGDGGSVIKKSIIEDVKAINKDFSKSISISSNPFQSNISIHSSIFSNQNTQLRIFNVTGEVVFEKQLLQTNELLDLRKLQSGVYFLTVREEPFSETVRLVKMD